jgi:hypothetical protein
MEEKKMPCVKDTILENFENLSETGKWLDLNVSTSSYTGQCLTGVSLL